MDSSYGVGWVGCWAEQFHVKNMENRTFLFWYCWWQPEIRRSPLEVGSSLIHHLTSFDACQLVFTPEFWTINSMAVCLSQFWVSIKSIDNKISNLSGWRIPLAQRPFWGAVIMINRLTQLSKKSPTVGPAERTPQPEYLIALATYLGVSW